jgi:hypothetical protein
MRHSMSCKRVSMAGGPCIYTTSTHDLVVLLPPARRPPASLLPPSSHHACHRAPQAFGDARDGWIARDEEGWLDANGFYERLGVRDAARDAAADVYIITTKQARFACALLKHAGIAIREDKVGGCSECGCVRRRV